MELRDPTEPSPTARSWRVRPALVSLKLAGTVVFLLAALAVIGDRTKVFAALVGAAVAGTLALRDLLAPVRLAADPDGVTVVTGFASRLRLPWSRIERVRVDERERLGLKSRLLEIDAGSSIHLFSTYELNAEVEEVAQELERIRP
jgi:hypothetical protein